MSWPSFFYNWWRPIADLCLELALLSEYSEHLIKKKRFYKNKYKQTWAFLQFIKSK